MRRGGDPNAPEGRANAPEGRAVARLRSYRGDELEKIKDMLREARIRYRSTDHAVQGNSLPSASPRLVWRDRAVAVIEDEFRQPDYVLVSAEAWGRPGFAITLSIGIVTTMFTAIFGSRLVVHLLYGRQRAETVWI